MTAGQESRQMRINGGSMSQIQILIADSDRAYVEALVNFLMGRKQEYGIRTFTEPTVFEEEICQLDWTEFDLIILGEAYLAMVQEAGLLGEMRRKAGYLLQLTEEKGQGTFGVDEMEKYQSMDFLVNLLGRVKYPGPLRLHEDSAGAMGAYMGELLATSGRQAACRGGNSDSILAVYSPMHHDLLLAFTLLMCRSMAQEGPVILMDLEENSRLSELLSCKWRGTLTDYLYLRSVNEGKLAEYLIYDEELAIMPPVDSPTELGRISPDQWQLLLSDLQETGARIVLLYDSFHQGAQLMLDHCRKMFLLSKQEPYYRRLTARTEGALRRQFRHLDLETMELPLSLGSRGEWNFSLEEIEAGNLGSYVVNQRHRWEEDHARRSVG